RDRNVTGVQTCALPIFDGTAINHPGLGGAPLLPSPSWIETLEVRGLGAGADVGDAQGGLVEVVTLRGRNVIEGALRTSFESERLDRKSTRLNSSHVSIS